MSQANELLNSLSDYEMAKYAGMGETEAHIVIGNDRIISVPASLKRIAVQYDHDVETVTFDCPRYWDGLDMSKMVVYINYMLSDGYTDAYPAKNVRANGEEIMHFEWTISRNVTQIPGAISFLVCVKKTDGEGNEINHWNSELCQSCYVSEGLETEEQIAMENSDLITQLLLRMDSVERINVTAGVMDAYVEEITTARDDAAATLEAIDNSAAEIRNSYANAIKGKASGEIVRVDDVSPLEHDVKCWVHGKNILPYPYRETTHTENGGTFTVQTDGGVSASGTPTDYVSINLYNDVPLAKSGNIVFSASGDYDNVSISMVIYDSANNVLFSDEAWRNRRPISANLDEYPTAAKWLVFIKRSSSNVEMTGVIYPQIELGVVETEYTPYIVPTAVNVTGCGKNLFDSSKLLSANGWTVSEQGVYSGQPASLYELFPASNPLIVGGFKPLTRYTMSFEAYSEVTTDRPIGLALMFKYDDGTSASIKIDKAAMTSFKLTSASGKTVTSVYTSYHHNTKTYLKNIQVEENSAKTPHEPYDGETCKPSADGSVNICSVNPTMTIFTDTPGVVVEAEYNRDTTKMFESYVLTDEAKSQIVAEVEDDMAEVLSALNAYATSVIGGGS